MGTQLRLKSLCVPANGPSCTGRSWRQAWREQVRPLTRSDCLAPILKYFSYRFLLKSSAYIYKCVYICEYPFSSRTLFSACSLLKAVNTPFDSVCGMQKRLLRENCHIPTLLKYLVSESPMVLYTPFLKWCFAINRNMAKDWKAHVLRSFHSSGLAGKKLVLAVLWCSAPWSDTLGGVPSQESFPWLLGSGYPKEIGERQEPLRQEENTNGNWAQKFIPLKLLITGKGSIHPQAYANLRETHREVPTAHSSMFVYSHHFTFIGKWRGRRFWHRVSFWSTVSHLTDWHRIAKCLFCSSRLLVGYLNFFKTSIVIYLQRVSISLCIVLSQWWL